MEAPIVIEDSMTREERIALQLTKSQPLMTKSDWGSTWVALGAVALVDLLKSDQPLERSIISPFLSTITLCTIALMLWVRWVQQRYCQDNVDALGMRWPTPVRYSISHEHLVVHDQFDGRTTLFHRDLLSVGTTDRAVMFQWRGLSTVQIHREKLTPAFWHRLRHGAPSGLEWPKDAC